MVTTVKFAKCNKNAKIPTKRKEDAGYDIYPCFEEEFIIIEPHQTKMIPTEICSAFDDDYVFVLKERGSTGTKGIGQRCGVIDSGFRNAWMIPITNHNDKKLIIYKTIDKEKYKDCIFYPYEKAICQALLLPVPNVVVEEYTYEEIQEIPSVRGKGMLGSSGK